MPLLSIIIPTWNEETHLGALLKSIKKQTFSDYEIIIADAQSTDATRTIAERYGARVCEGGYPAEGRNAGAEAAVGSLFLFLDADALLVSKQFLRDHVKELHARRIDIASVTIAADGGYWMDKLFYTIYNRYTRLLTTIRPHATGACIFSKRFVHEQIGGFDTSITFAEDQDYVQRGSGVGTFGILRAHPIVVSSRRLEYEGRLKFALKYLYAEWRILTRRPIRNHEITYDLRNR